MGFVLALMTMLSLDVPASGEMSRQQLVQLIDAAQESNCRDVSFDYEGRQVAPGKKESDGVMLDYTGSFSRRADGASLVDLYLSDKSTGNFSRGVVAILKGTTESSLRRADQKKANITIKTQGPLEFAGPGNYREIWLADFVKKLAGTPYRYEYEGVRQLDGEDCVVVRFRLVLDDSTPKDKTVSYLFWIDLKRGGHVIRHERRFLGENLGSLTTVRLERFEKGPGRVAWLPISGRVESLMDSKDQKLVFLAKPVLFETYDLLPITLRFDRGMKDDAFSVKAKAGDAISDEVRKARYEFGQYMVRQRSVIKRTNDAEIRANLDRMLKDSAVMAGELKASSPLRDGPGLLSSWPWALAGLAILGAGFVYYKGRNQ
jgi:hypothetical protein